MQAQQKTIAYIDAANLHKGTQSSDWKMDYRKFRSWIRQKYGVVEAYLFIGLMPKHAALYTALQSAGFTLVFKEVVYDGAGRAKGNCDADLVIRAMRDYFEKGSLKTILVSSDGDYAPLVSFWLEKTVSCTVVSPAPLKRCSILLKKTGVPILCLDDVKHKLYYNPK